MKQTADRTFLLRVIAAFAALYVIWGSTYFAIRVTLDSMSPAASAAARFVIAGPFLLLLARLNGHAIVPPRRELVSLAHHRLLACWSAATAWWCGRSNTWHRGSPR